MAGGCPLLLSYTTPGERLRGCTFAEGFKSYSDLVQNSESITGSPTVADGVCTLNGASWIDYRQQAFSKDFTVQLTFKAALADGILISSNDATSGIRIQTIADGNINIFFIANGVNALSRSAQDIGVNPTWYNDGNWHTLFLSVSRTAGTYTYVVDGVVKVNAGALVATTGPVGVGSPLRIGATTVSGVYPYTGQIKDVKIWDTALDVAEAQAYYNETMQQFAHRATLVLPMTAACHDAVNGRTLDVSGNGNHAVFAAGAQAPTKLSGKRGYSFTSPALSQYMDSPFKVSSGDWTICLNVKSFYRTDRNYLFSIDAGAVQGLIAAFTGVTTSWISPAGVGMSITDQGPSSRSFAVRRYDIGGGVKQYALCVDGVVRGTTTTLGDEAFDLTRIGCRGDFGGYYYNGEIYQMEAWNQALNATQLLEWHARSLKQVNDV